MYLLLDPNNMVICISSKITLDLDKNGYYDSSANSIYTDTVNLKLVETELDCINFEPIKYCYTEESGFYPNVYYQEPMSLEESTAELKQLKQLVADLTELVLGGV